MASQSKIRTGSHQSESPHNQKNHSSSDQTEFVSPQADGCPDRNPAGRRRAPHTDCHTNGPPHPSGAHACANVSVRRTPPICLFNCALSSVAFIGNREIWNNQIHLSSSQRKRPHRPPLHQLTHGQSMIRWWGKYD